MQEAWHFFLYENELRAAEREGVLSRAEAEAIREDRAFWIVRDFGEAPLPFHPHLTRPIPTS